VPYRGSLRHFQRFALPPRNRSTRVGFLAQSQSARSAASDKPSGSTIFRANGSLRAHAFEYWKPARGGRGGERRITKRVSIPISKKPAPWAELFFAAANIRAVGKTQFAACLTWQRGGPAFQAGVFPSTNCGRWSSASLVGCRPVEIDRHSGAAQGAVDPTLRRAPANVTQHWYEGRSGLRNA
jgi:hypothetical protein